MVNSTMTETVPSSGRGGTAAATVMEVRLGPGHIVLDGDAALSI